MSQNTQAAAATKSKFSVRDICYAGLFAAVIAVMAQISIPMPLGVPMTMQTFAITLAAVVLGSKLSAIATLVYLALGAVGGAGVCAGFPYLPQLLSGSGGLEVSQDDGCSHVQLSDTGGDYRCFPHLGARPFQLDASRCHCHDLYQRVLC